MKNKITVNLVQYKIGCNVYCLVLAGGALNPITFYYSILFIADENM